MSKAQGETLADHSLVFYKIGEYLPHGNSAITVSAPTQNVENALYQFLTAEASAGGLKEAFPDVTYSSADGEALNWLLTSNYLGSDATGQNLSQASDNAVRLLANYLYSNDHGIGWTQETVTHGQVTTNDGYQEETYTLPNPGIYLVVDSTNNGNTAMPMIVSTVATGDTGYTGPLTQYMTSQIGLKTQDPQATPVKQFVKDPQTSTAEGTADITGSLTNSMTASVGSANSVTYQISNVFPNFNGYPAYTYKFIDNPGTGMTLNIDGGQNMYIAGIPLSALFNAVDTSADPSGAQILITKYCPYFGSTMPAVPKRITAAITPVRMPAPPVRGRPIRDFTFSTVL